MVAVGPGARDQVRTPSHPQNGQLLPMAVQVGERVLLPSFGGSIVKVGDQEYSLYRDSELLAKLTQ